jgi:hypothetical protein
MTTAFAENDMICGTQEAFERFQRGDKLVRPPNGPLYIYTPHFVIHFDTTGTHACTRAYAETTATFAEFCWEKQIGGLGWAAPPPDTGGPDSLYDIYIRYTDPYYGLCYWESPYPDPYPTGITSYILIRNSMSWVDLRGTVAHEFNHACQGRYSSQYIWWYENVATWMDVICTGDVSWAIWCLTTSPNPLWDPHLSIENTTNRYEYAGFLWVRFLQEYYSITCLRLIWEEIGLVGGYSTLTAIDSVLRYYDSNLEMALGNYAIWRYFTGDRADTIGHFSESHLMPTSYVDPSHQHDGPGSGNQGAYYLYGPGGTSFIEFYTTPDYLLKSSFSGSVLGEWQIWNIGYSTATGHRQYMMDSVDYWSVLPTTWHDTTVLIPTVMTPSISSFSYDYFGVDISLMPTPPQDPELEIRSILSPVDTITSYSNITPSAVRRNNATNSAVDTTWASFYIGDCYSDSREIGPLSPGQTDTISFTDWTALGCNSLDVRCVGGGGFDVDIANNCCDTSTFIPWSDVEVLEILAPRGIVAHNVAVEPRVLLRNNGTSGNIVFVSFTIESYADTNSIYIGPDSCVELAFDNWIPAQMGICTTSCVITTPDQRPCNDILLGEVLVDSITSLEENQIYGLSQYTLQANPNPFSKITDIRYQVRDNRYQIADNSLKLRIYDVTGRLVKEFNLHSAISDHQSAVSWDGTDSSNRKLPSGVYFLEFQAGDYSATEKMLLIR